MTPEAMARIATLEHELHQLYQGGVAVVFLLLACIFLNWLKGRTAQMETMELRAVCDNHARHIAMLDAALDWNDQELDGVKDLVEHLRAMARKDRTTFRKALDDLGGRIKAVDFKAGLAGREAARTRLQLGLPEPLAEVPGMGGEITLTLSGSN
jgi:hypothetical protein